MLATALVLTGCGDPRFHCQEDDECLEGDVQGVCQATGFCSFPDEACESGQRYGKHAGGRTGRCVPVEEVAETATGTSAGTDPHGTGESTGSAATCGDGRIDANETCDGDDLGGADCVSLGYFGGTLSCTDACTLDESACDRCGDGRVQDEEDCEPDQPLATTCEGLGWYSGSLSCGTDCRFDTSGCTNCGNGVVEEGEACDGKNGDFPTCAEAGYDGVGALVCGAECQFSAEACDRDQCGVDPQTPVGRCPDACDSCAGDVCTILCDGGFECNSIMCPEGWPCNVVCSGSYSCSTTSIACPDLYACTVSCSGLYACSTATVSCGSDASCALECDSGFNVCSATQLECGAGKCSATCETSSAPTVSCGPSCDCEPC